MTVTLTRIDETSPARIAARALDALGPTPSAVATALTAAGFTGIAESARSCPIARYLHATDPRLTGVTVLFDGIQLDTADETALVELTYPVLGFVARFDRGVYPHLTTSSCLTSYRVDPGTTARSEACS
jgi:hypothetical protein